MGAQAPPKFAHRTIQAPDGASLSYYTIGQGPGLVILHGSILYAVAQSGLAVLLSSSYTVYLPSTRGRGFWPNQSRACQPSALQILKPYISKHIFNSESRN